MPPMNDDLDLSRPLRALKRFAWLVLLLSLAAGAVTYLISSRQTPVYQARTLILSAGGQTSNPTVGTGVVSPPPLPSGAIEGALQSENVLGVVRRRLSEIPELTQAQRLVLADRLAQDIASSRGRVLGVAGQPDIYGNGTYTLTATHRDPVVAARLANLAADSLVAWDAGRGLVKVDAAVSGLRARLADVERRLTAAGPVVGTPTSLQQTLLAQRANRLDALNNLLALRETVVGSLSVVAPAPVPLRPVAPKPLRNALLVGGFMLLLLGALLVVWSSVNRMVVSDADLKLLNLRLLGEVPRVRLLRRGQSLLVALRQGRWSDSVAFLAAGVKSVLPKNQPPVLLVTSLFSGDGKSNISAALADARAASGDRVLLIDADLRRPTQASIWQAGAQTAEWVDLPGAVPFPGEESRDLLGALSRPVTAQARRLRDNLHLLAPAPGVYGNPQAQLPAEGFREAVAQWGAGYDLIVVDGPPALAVADPLVIAPHAAGVLLVLEAGRASVSSVQRVLDALLLVNANVLGVALNKVNPRGQVARYGYGYARRSTPAATPKPESRVL